MREKKSFIERTRIKKDDSVRVKYFLVFEGSETEEIYFDAVNTNKVDLGISPIIELIPLIRDFGEEGWSNPKKIVDRVIANVEESESGKMTYDILLNRFMDYMMSTGIIKGKPQAQTVWNTLKWICEQELSEKLDGVVGNVDEAAAVILESLIKNSSIEGIADNISKILKSLSITYDSEIDHICIIVDRDKDSFVVNDRINQYQYVLDSCSSHGFDLYITNPCFEFWLLLHFDDYDKLDVSKLLENPKETKKKKYTETELSKRISFKKNKFDADSLVKDLPKAVANEKYFCEDLNLLENNVGSNLGKLFDSIISKDI